MIVTYDNGVFYWRGKYDDRNEPRDAGFHWDGKRWATDSVQVASKLDLYADNRALEVMSSYFKKLRKIKKLRKSRAKEATLNVPVPEGLKYRGYQLAGIDYCRNMDQAIIGDDMGIGKTIQAIGLANLWKCKRVLVVCPAFLQYNWHREAAKWLVDNIHFETCSYATTRNKDYKKPWDLVIVDECQYIKTPTSQRTKATLRIPFKKRIFLTGTPILNCPIEMWPILYAINPKLWGKEIPFAQKFCGAYQFTPVDRWGHKVINRKTGREAKEWFKKGISNAEEFQEQLRSTCMIRRLKSEVLDLPPVTRQVIELDIRGFKEPKITEEEKLQFDDKLLFNAYSKVRHEIALAKIPEAIKFIRHAVEAKPDSKIVVFAHHLDVLEALSREFSDCSTLLTGETPPNRKEANLALFDESPDCHLFLGQIKACGVGLNITCSDHVIFVESAWDPSTIDQAFCRVYRSGQERPVLCQHLVVNNSIEARMAHAVVHKQNNIETCLDSAPFNWRDVV